MMNERWWWQPLPGHDQSRPVLFFPPAGADQTVARPLIDSLAGLPLGVLRLPGRGPRHDEPAPDSLASLVAEITETVLVMPGPAPVLVGHSFGGLLAYAVALECGRQGREPALLMPVASTAPPTWLPDPGEDRHDFAARRTEQVMRLGGVPEPMRGDRAMQERVTGLVLADLTLATEIVPGTLSCRICALTPDQDIRRRSVDPRRWVEMTTGETELIKVPGGHFFYRDRPTLLTTRVRMERALLDDAFELA